MWADSHEKYQNLRLLLYWITNDPNPKPRQHAQNQKTILKNIFLKQHPVQKPKKGVLKKHRLDFNQKNMSDLFRPLFYLRPGFQPPAWFIVFVAYMYVHVHMCMRIPRGDLIATC